MNIKSIVVLLAITLPDIACAGEATGTIASIEVSDSSPTVLFTLSSPIRDTPRCNEKEMFSISLKKVSGQAAYAALLEAKQREYETTVTGLNTCTNEWKVEDVKNIKIH